MDCTFQVGDKVVCAHEISPKRFYGWETLPQFGAVYTVREVFAGSGGRIGIRLVEIVNQPGDYQGGIMECGFNYRNFRPVEKPKRETSIEIFRKIDRDVFGKVDA